MKRFEYGCGRKWMQWNIPESVLIDPGYPISHEP